MIGLIEFLQNLSPALYQRLYARQCNCLAVFRLLTPREQKIVIRLMLLDSLVSKSAFNDMDTETDEDFANLVKLNLLETENDLVRLNRTFQEQFTHLLYGYSESAEFGFPSAGEYHPLADLEKISAGRWESILHFMVGSEVQVSLPKGVLDLLLSSELMAKNSDKSYNSLRITKKGFQFLLQNLSTQLWTILLQYVEISEQMNMDMIEVLSFFFLVNHLEIGKPYSCASYSRSQLKILHDLKDFGICYQMNDNNQTFYTTPLAAHLSLDHGNKTSKLNEAFIMLETNYRVYSYSSSPLQIAILALFVQLKVRFPNLVVGIITRDSVRNALSKGITASQIVHFLKTHAHSQMIKELPSSQQESVVPQTVIDQINLWEMELNRLKFSPGCLYRKFAFEKEYRMAVEYAREVNVLIWESSDIKNRCFVVTSEGNELVKQFVKALIVKRQASVV